MSGYAIESVASAEAAQIRLAATPFALLMTDWDLDGGMNGDALIVWAKTHFPDLKTILLSNHLPDGEFTASCVADAVLRKIESNATLRQAVMDLAPLDTGHA